MLDEPHSDMRVARQSYSCKHCSSDTQPPSAGCRRTIPYWPNISAPHPTKMLLLVLLLLAQSPSILVLA